MARSSFVAAPAAAAWSPVAGIEVQLLGRFLVRRAGEEVPAASFGGRLVRVLVRLLVSRRGNFVSRDVLAEALWPERMPADPSTNLRVLVQRARAALGDPHLIVTGPGGYSFAVGAGCDVDTEVLLAAGSRPVRSTLAAGQAGAALREFRSALDLWAGDPLAEDAYEDWAQEIRGGLGARLSPGAGERSGGGAGGAATRARPWPWPSGPWPGSRSGSPPSLLLARALAASGDQVGALRAIDRCAGAWPRRSGS